MEAPAPRPTKSDRAFCIHSDKSMRGVLRKEMGQSNKNSVIYLRPQQRLDSRANYPCRA